MGGKGVLAFPSLSLHFPVTRLYHFFPSHEYHLFMVENERKKARKEKEREIKHDEAKVATTARDAGYMGGKSVVLAFPSPSIFPSHICTIFSRPTNTIHLW